jgi:hypothetical protein
LTVADLATLPIGSLPGLVTMAGADSMAGLAFQVTGETAGQMVILLPSAPSSGCFDFCWGRRRSRGRSRLRSGRLYRRWEHPGLVIPERARGSAGEAPDAHAPEIYFDDVPGLMRRVRQGSTPGVGGPGSPGFLGGSGKADRGRFFFLPEMASLEALLHGAGSGVIPPPMRGWGMTPPGWHP